MNLEKIFNEQEKLDLAILKKAQDINHDITMEQRNRQSIIALLIELGEFMNELETFKYWKQNRKNNTQALMEEFADVMHFMISWAVTLKIDSNIEPLIINQDPNEQYISCLKSVVEWFDEPSAKNVAYSCRLLLGICELMGIDYEDIEAAYMAKNKINYDRVANKY